MDVARAGGRLGDGGRREHRRVDAVGGVGEGGVPVGLFRGGRRGARVGPAVDVRADQGADPFAERVAVAGRVRGLDAVQEVAVGDSFRGERAACGEFVQPQAGHVRGGEVLAVALEQQEVQEGVVEVVVLRHAVDVLGEGGGGGAAVPGVGCLEVRGEASFCEPGGQGPVAGGSGQCSDAVQGELFHWLAEEAACGSAQPGGLQAGVECGGGRGRFFFPRPTPSRNWGRCPQTPGLAAEVRCAHPPPLSASLDRGTPIAPAERLPTAVSAGLPAAVGQLWHRALILGRAVGSLSFNPLGRSASSSRRSWARARR